MDGLIRLEVNLDEARAALIALRAGQRSAGKCTRRHDELKRIADYLDVQIVHQEQILATGAHI